MATGEGRLEDPSIFGLCLSFVIGFWQFSASAGWWGVGGGRGNVRKGDANRPDNTALLASLLPNRFGKVVAMSMGFGNREGPFGPMFLHTNGFT